MEDMSLCMKNKSHNLSEIEKAYILFYWFHLNIEYDADGYFKGGGIWQPDLVYKYGKGICSGYSKLYIYFGKAIGINVDSISGYAKGYGWNKDHEPNISHQWNYIIIKNVYYLFDVTWGSGCFKNNKYEKRLDAIHFLPSPRNYLFTYLPSYSKFQLVENPITLDEFRYSIKVPDSLLTIGFFPNIIRSNCTVNNKEKFIIN